MLGNHHKVIQENFGIEANADSLFQISVGTRTTAKEKDCCIYQISTVFAFKGIY